jgi:hypothetical protein
VYRPALNIAMLLELLRKSSQDQRANYETPGRQFDCSAVIRFKETARQCQDFNGHTVTGVYGASR